MIFKRKMQKKSIARRKMVVNMISTACCLQAPGIVHNNRRLKKRRIYICVLKFEIQDISIYMDN